MQRLEKKRIILSHDKCIVMQPILVKKLGRSNALLLQQINYWIEKKETVGIIHEGKRWVYNTSKDWSEDLQVISERTVIRSIASLREKGILITRALAPKKSNRTNYVTIDYDRLFEVIGEGEGSFVQTKCTSKEIPTNTVNRTDDAENPTKINAKMAPSSSQNDSILYKDTKITSKNIILSEEKSPALSPQISSQHVVEEKKINLVEELIKIWNKTVEEGRQVIGLTKRRSQFLVAAFKSKFNSSIEKWRDYCKKIASSKFLMGEVNKSFKATIDWGLKFDVIQKILEGSYGVGDRIISKALVIDVSQVKNQIQTGDEDEKIKEIRCKLLTHFGEATYIAWFKDVRLEFDGSEMINIKAKSRFCFDFIQTHYGRNLAQILNSKISFAVSK